MGRSTNIKQASYQPACCSCCALELANALSRPSGAVIVINSWPPGLASAAIVGMQLRRRPGLAFRALVENWTLEQTIKELN